MIRDHRFPRGPDVYNFCRRSFPRIFILATIWIILTGADISSWVVGVPTILITAGLSLRLTPPSSLRISLTGALHFTVFFLRQSFLGGIDVMRRALSPRQLLNPGLVPYTTFLPEGPARIFFVNIISLLPGTLSAELDGNHLTIHTLDRDQPIWAGIQSLEYHVAIMMRISPGKTKSP